MNEIELTRIALSFLSANIDQANDEFDSWIDINQVNELEKKLYALQEYSDNNDIEG